MKSVHSEVCMAQGRLAELCALSAEGTGEAKKFRFITVRTVTFR